MGMRAKAFAGKFGGNRLYLLECRETSTRHPVELILELGFGATDWVSVADTHNCVWELAGSSSSLRDLAATHGEQQHEAIGSRGILGKLLGSGEKSRELAETHGNSRDFEGISGSSNSNGVNTNLDARS